MQSFHSCQTKKITVSYKDSRLGSESDPVVNDGSATSRQALLDLGWTRYDSTLIANEVKWFNDFEAVNLTPDIKATRVGWTTYGVSSLQTGYVTSENRNGTRDLASAVGTQSVTGGDEVLSKRYSTELTHGVTAYNHDYYDGLIQTSTDYTIFDDLAGIHARTERLRYFDYGTGSNAEYFSAYRSDDVSDRMVIDTSKKTGFSSYNLSTGKVVLLAGQGSNSYSVMREYLNSNYILMPTSGRSNKNVINLNSLEDQPLVIGHEKDRTNALGSSNALRARTGLNSVAEFDIVNLDHFIVGGVATTGGSYRVYGTSDGLDKVIGTLADQTYFASHSKVTIDLWGQAPLVSIGDKSTVNLRGGNAMVSLDLDMSRFLNQVSRSERYSVSSVKAAYGLNSVLTLGSTSSLDAANSQPGSVTLNYTVGNLPSANLFGVRVSDVKPIRSPGANFGTLVDVKSVEVSGNAVILRLNQSISASQWLSINYTKPSDAGRTNSIIEDKFGNDADSFSVTTSGTLYNLRQIKVEHTAPTVLKSTVRGNQIEIKFDQNLLTGNRTATQDDILLPTVGLFEVSVVRTPSGSNVPLVTTVKASSIQVSGDTVTLTLPNVITDSDAVQIKYAPAISDDRYQRALQNLAGVDVNPFVSLAVNTSSDTTAPTVSSIALSGNTVVVVFSERIDSSNLASLALFSQYSLELGTVSANLFTPNGTTINVNGGTIDGNTITLNLSSVPVASNGAPIARLSYVKNGGSAGNRNLADYAGNIVNNFTQTVSLPSVANTNAANGVIASISGAKVKGRVVTIGFSVPMNLTPGSLLDASMFTVNAAGTNDPVTSARVLSATEIELQLGLLVSANVGVLFSYTAPSSGGLRDTQGQALPKIQNLGLINITQDSIAPLAVDARVNGGEVRIQFSEVLASDRAPSVSAFRVLIDGVEVKATRGYVQGKYAYLFLAREVKANQTVVVSYVDPTPKINVGSADKSLQDASSNAVAGFSRTAINVTGLDLLAPQQLGAVVVGNKIVLTFDEPLANESTRAPLASNFVVKAGADTKVQTISSVVVSQRTVTITLANAVEFGDNVYLNYVAPTANSNQNRVQDASLNATPSFYNMAVSNLTSDKSLPTLSLVGKAGGLDSRNVAYTDEYLVAEASLVSDSMVVLKFNKTLAGSESLLPDVSSFKVLTLSRADKSKYNLGTAFPWTTPGSDKFNAWLSKAGASYTVPGVIFNPGGDAVNTIAVTSVRVFENAVLLDLATPVKENAGIAISYVRSVKNTGGNVKALPTVEVTTTNRGTYSEFTDSDLAKGIQDRKGNRVANFPLINIDDVSGLPILQGTKVNGNTLVLTYNQLLLDDNTDWDGNTGGNTNQSLINLFRVKVNDTAVAVNSLAIDNFTVTLTLAQAVKSSEEVVVDYAAPDESSSNVDHAIQSRTGKNARSATNILVTNTTALVDSLSGSPRLISSSVNGDIVTLLYDKSLNQSQGLVELGYLPDGEYDASGNQDVIGRVNASGFVNIIGSNKDRDSYVFNDQSSLSAVKRLRYFQAGDGNAVKILTKDRSGDLTISLSLKGYANVLVDEGSNITLMTALSSKVVTSSNGIDKEAEVYKAKPDHIELRSNTKVSALLSGYETIDASNPTSSIVAKISAGKHDIKLGGQNASFVIDRDGTSTTKVVSTPYPALNSAYQAFDLSAFNADELYIGTRTVNGYKHTTLTASFVDEVGDQQSIRLDYKGAPSEVLLKVNSLLVPNSTSDISLSRLLSVMAVPSFATAPEVVAHTKADSGDGSATQQMYRLLDVVKFYNNNQS